MKKTNQTLNELERKYKKIKRWNNRVKDRCQQVPDFTLALKK